MKLVSKIQNEDWYQGLIDEINSTIVQHVKLGNEVVLVGYYKAGKLLLKNNYNFRRHKVYGNEIVQCVAKSCNKSPRTIYYAKKFAEVFDNFEDIYKLKEGEAITWGGLIKNHLTQTTTRENPPEIEAPKITCPNCGFKF